MDCVQYVLGDIENIQARLQLQRPDHWARMNNHKPRWSGRELGRRELEPVESNRPDMIFLHGTLPASEAVAEGAIISITYTDCPAASGEPSLEWTFQLKYICNELRIRVYDGPTMNRVGIDCMRNSNGDQSTRVVIEQRSHSGSWKECNEEFSTHAWYEEFAQIAGTKGNIAALWDGFASEDGPEHPKRYWQWPSFKRPDFELALKRQKQIVDILDGFYQASGPDKALN
jgi:hypothetical protein